MAEPRAGSEQMGGIPWLARMTDKARLQAAGQLEQYDLDYPCPMDQNLLRQLGIDSDIFQRIAVSASTDAQILFELQRIGANVPKTTP